MGQQGSSRAKIPLPFNLHQYHLYDHTVDYLGLRQMILNSNLELKGNGKNILSLLTAKQCGTLLSVKNCNKTIYR